LAWIERRHQHGRDGVSASSRMKCQKTDTAARVRPKTLGPDVRAERRSNFA